MDHERRECSKETRRVVWSTTEGRGLKISGEKAEYMKFDADQISDNNLQSESKLEIPTAF